MFGDKNPLINPTNPYIIVRPMGLSNLNPLERCSNIIENNMIKEHAKETNGDIARMPSSNSLSDEDARIFESAPPCIPAHNIIHKLNGMKECLIEYGSLSSILIKIINNLTQDFLETYLDKSPVSAPLRDPSDKYG